MVSYPVGKFGDHLVDTGGPTGLDQIVVGRLGPGVPEVGADALVEEVGVLADDPDRPAQRVLPEGAHVETIDGDRTARHVVEPGNE